MDKERNQGEQSFNDLSIIRKILFVLVIVFIGYIVYFFYNFSYVVHNDELNKVCTDYGYKKATDSRYVYEREYSGEERLILIECDNKVINNKLNNYLFWDTKWFEIITIGDEWCAQTDKWGDCISYGSNKTHIILH